MRQIAKPTPKAPTLYFYFICRGVLHAHHLYAWCLGELEEGVRSPGTGLIVVRHHVCLS